MILRVWFGRSAIVVERDDVGRVRVKREMQFIWMTQKLLEGGDPALVFFGTSVFINQRANSPLWLIFLLRAFQ